MIYYILRPIVRWTLKLYFRKIYLVGLDNIPKDKAVIFASNHPSAFIEPCMLACFLPVQLHFLVRGDLFSLSWLSWLLRGTNQIPIFRQRDGLDNVRKNIETQDKVRELFAENKAVLMFPEAHTHENLFLRPLKKGIARFAFMDHGADCYIVPVGVNFDKNIPFNSKVSIVLGEAIRIEDYKSQVDHTPAQQMKNLLNDLTIEMKQCLRHIDDEEKEEEIHSVYRLLDNERKFKAIPITSKKSHVFEEEKKIASIIDKNDKKYQSISNFLNVQAVKKAEKPNFLDLILMILLSPFFLVGFLLHIIPDRLAKWLVLSKVKEHEFKAPVYIAVITFGYLFLFLFFTILILILGKIGVYFLVFFILTGLFSVLYLKIWGNKLKYMFRPKIKEPLTDKLHKIIFD